MLKKDGLYFAYLRKSREDRDAELRGEMETLVRHKRILNDLAKRSGIVIAKWYPEIVSGETIAARPRMLELLNDIETSSPDGILVVEIERLARGDTRDQGLIMETFKYADTKIITPSKVYDPNDEFDEEYAEFGLFMSRREYKTINRRLQNGRRSSFREGKWTGNKAPYGYERVKLPSEKGFMLKIVPTEASVVKLIYQLYLHGTSESNNIPIGSSKICRILDSTHVVPPAADVWQDYTIRNILDNPVYSGMLRSGRRKQQKKIVNGIVIISRPVSSNVELQRGMHEAIIDDDTFQEAQAKRKSNYRKPFFESIKNPLAGLIYCSECNKSMYRRPAGERCPQDMICCHTHGCPTSASYYSLIEENLMQALSDWLETYRISILDHSLDNIGEVLLRKESLLAQTSEELVGHRKQLSKCMDLLEKDIYSVEMFQQRSFELNEKIAFAQKLCADLQLEINDLKLNSKSKAEIIPRFEHVLNSYHTIDDPAAKNALLKQVLVKIDYTKAKKGNRFTGGMDNFTLKLYPRI